MKKTKLMYRIFTGVFAALMAFTAIPDVLMLPDATNFMTALGYPPYFTPFIGIAKLLGVLCIILPGQPVLKEWAYAGLFFDLIGAHYSQLAVIFSSPAGQNSQGGGAAGVTIFMVIFYAIGGTSYYYYRRRLREKRLEATPAAA